MSERTIFLSAMELDSAEERAAFLDSACAGNTELRGRIDALLQAHQQAGGVIDELASVGERASGTPSAEKQIENIEGLTFLTPSEIPGSIGSLGDYDVLDVIGRGGAGIVLKARDLKLQRIVAIKVLAPEVAANKLAKTRFSREARSAAAVSHDHIVTIHAVDEANGVPFIVMECIVGCSLQQKIEETGSLELKEILRIGLQTAQGLAAAHKQGIVHRDIKPGNILLQNGIQRVKISDFGLARAAADVGMTDTGQIMGTPLYMSPEQALGETTNHRSDLFSLGSMLYSMCTGRPAFRAKTHMAVLRRVCEGLPTPIRELNPEIPEWMVEIVNTLMSKQQNDRYESANEVAELLSRHLKELQEPATDGVSRPDVISQEVSRLPRRWVFGVGAAVLMLLGTALVLINKNDGTKAAIKIPDASKVEITTTSPTASPPLAPQSDAAWQGWPVDAPSPAISPFDAEQARKYQEVWARYLEVPVEYTNSIGMKFRLIPPGEFLMGSAPHEQESALATARGDDWWTTLIRSESPRHKVILTQPFYLAVGEVTQAEYEAVMGMNPSEFSPQGARKNDAAGMDTGRHPVEMVNCVAAAQFCNKLNQSEKLPPLNLQTGEGVTRLDGVGYRLPTEAEWEFACRAGTTTRYWTGDREEDLLRAGWFNTTSGGRTHVAGELPANPFGLFDVHGNVWEWVQDEWSPTYYGEFFNSLAVDPLFNSHPNSRRIIRGGSWPDRASYCRASNRNANAPTDSLHHFGFRVALSVNSLKAAIQPTSSPLRHPKSNAPNGEPDPAKPKVTDSDSQTTIPSEITSKTTRMRLALIPAGKFQMGSPATEVARDDNEGPMHSVRVSQFYMGVHEVTQAVYEKVMGQNPSGFRIVPGMDTTLFPVEHVSWGDAVEFCNKLSEADGLAPRYRIAGIVRGGDLSITAAGVDLIDGTGYRLPTEAEWEYACRAAPNAETNAAYHFGGALNGDKANMKGNQPYGTATRGPNLRRTTTVGSYPPNEFGLYDMHGNVWEWCFDAYDPSAYKRRNGMTIDPVVTTGWESRHVIRGGSYNSNAWDNRAARRFGFTPGEHYGDNGFRVVR